MEGCQLPFELCIRYCGGSCVRAFTFCTNAFRCGLLEGVWSYCQGINCVSITLLKEHRVCCCCCAQHAHYVAFFSFFLFSSPLLPSVPEPLWYLHVLNKVVSLGPSLLVNSWALSRITSPYQIMTLSQDVPNRPFLKNSSAFSVFCRPCSRLFEMCCCHYIQNKHIYQITFCCIRVSAPYFLFIFFP